MSRAGTIQRAIDDPRVRSALTTVNQTLFDRGIRHGMLLESLKQTEVNAVVRYLNNEVAPDVAKILNNRLRRVARMGVDTGPWTTQYYRDMMSETLGTIRGGMEFTSKRITEQLTKIGYAEAEFARDSLKDALPFNFDARVPSLQSVRAIVKGVPVEGKLLPRWFKELGEWTQSEINRQVNLGLVNGEPIQKIVRRVIGTKAKQFADGVFATTRRNAETLVRTHVTHVSNKARELTYEENMDVIKGVQYVATLDARTTDICAGLDGEVFKPTEGPRPPLHMNCRSTTVPITKSWDELGKEMKTDAFSKLKEPRTENQLRASMNGAVPAKTTYNAWLKGQSAEFQNSVLGRRRAQVFRNDRLHLSRFVNYGTFPPRSLTVAELVAYEKAVIAGTKPGGRGGISGLGTGGKKVVAKKKKVTKKVTQEPAPTPPPQPAPQPAAKPTSQMTGDELAAEVKRLHGDRIVDLQNKKLDLDELLEQKRVLEKQRHLKAREIEGRLRATDPKVKGLRDERMELNKSLYEAKRTYKRSRTKVNKQAVDSLDKKIQALWQEELAQINAAAERELGDDFVAQIMRVRSMHARTSDEYWKFHAQLRDDIHEMLFLDKSQRGASLTLRGAKLTQGETFAEEWGKAKEWLEKVVHRDTADDRIRSTVVSRQKAGTRASCASDGTLNMASNDLARTWVHEWVHRVEDLSEAHMASSRAFFNRRVRRAKARGEKIESLSKLTGGNYGASEQAWKDDFYRAYCGKPYFQHDPRNSAGLLTGRGKVYGNEVATMGIEELFADPMKLLAADADHFAFSVDFLRSNVGKNFGRKWTDDLLRTNGHDGRLLD